MDEHGTNSQIIGGDINSFAGIVEPVYRVFINNKFKEANRYQSTVRGMPFPLDNIFVKGYFFEDVFVNSSQTCSDHYPIVAKLRSLKH